MSHGDDQDHKAALAAGAQIGPYEIEAPLGTGKPALATAGAAHEAPRGTREFENLRI